MDAWIIWLGIAGVLLIVEVLTQTLWCLAMAFVCFVVSMAALFGASFNVQMIIMVVAAVASYFLLMPFFRHQRHLRSQPDNENARTGMDALLGRKAYVTQEILPGRIGRVRIDGDNWQVRAPGVDEVIQDGTEVIVTGYDSIVLEVAVKV